MQAVSRLNLKHAWLLFGLSGCLVAFGQPAWSQWAGVLSSLCGFALFWIPLSSIFKTKKRFVISTAWYALVQAIQLSWMTSIEFQGLYILGVYAVVCICLGIQFGALSIFVAYQQDLGWMRILAAASLWTVFEWSRLFFICGFSWNPVGLSLTSAIWTAQFSSLWGILGLSFWVILTNLCIFKFWKNRTKRAAYPAILIALFPCVFGIVHIRWQEQPDTGKEVRSFTVALLQTGLLPSEKIPMQGKVKAFIPPLDQWRRIFEIIKEDVKVSPDLIVLPEAAVPYRADLPLYPYENVSNILKEAFGREIARKLPLLQPPFAEKRNAQGKLTWYVSNLYLCQALANIYGAEVIAGLDAQDERTGKNFNAAFHLKPMAWEANRYEKQVLLPMAEYLPFNVFRSLSRYYGITEFFSRGESSSLFTGRIPLSVSICYEETFPEIVRQGRRNGADLLVNVTNDNYYPNSQLPRQHFDHARLRSIENGVPLIRSCNTGITAGIDSMGRTVSMLGDGGKSSEMAKGALVFPIRLNTYKTLYTFWGDSGIIAFAILFIFSFCRLKFFYEQ